MPASGCFSMYYAVTVPIVILLSVGIGFFMAKKFESIGTGKVFAALSFFMLMVVTLLIRFIMNQ